MEKRSLTRYLRKFFGSGEDVEDALHDTIVNALAARNAEPIREPRAFLYRIARIVAINKKKRQEKILFENMGDLADSIAVDTSPGPDRRTHSGQKYEVFCEVLESLPPRCRQVFLMQRIHGLTYAQIAGRLNISPKTVEKHVAKALQRCIAGMSAGGYPDDTGGKVTDIGRYRSKS